MDRQYQVGDLIYDGSIYDGMNTQQDDLPFYRKWMPKYKEAKILELCCGTGRLTLPLAQEGFHITGVDITPSMLKKAREKATEKGLSLTFLEADMRTLDLPDQYDMIFTPFNSIHHLYANEDLFNALKVVKKHLEKGGLFLFDCFNPNIRYITEAEKEEREMAQYKTDDGRQILIKQTMRYDSATQVNSIKWHHYINGMFDSTQALDMRMYFPQELDMYLKSAGFEVIHKYGSFEEAPFDDHSEKQIFVCR